jgi:hopanoid biosynthesis associated protein HpnK
MRTREFAVARHNSHPGSRLRSGSPGLIVHADDFGISENVNEGILLAHTRGIVTSASIMAGGAAFEHAVAMSHRTPSLDVGVHVTLTGERPLLPAADVRSLVDGEGRFPDHATAFGKRYLLGRIRPGEVRKEIEAQLKTVRNAGIKISHVDSHQHVHMFPMVFAILLDLIKEYGIPAVRIPRERLSAKLFWRSRSIMRVLQLLTLNALCERALRVSGPVLRPQHFAGFLFGGKLTATNLRYLLENVPSSGCCEIMCHPGLDDPESRYGHWGYQWAAEIEALLDPQCGDILRQRGIPLISYRHLSQKYSPTTQEGPIYA